ncbi:MAG TPA: hypothetical protein VNR65_18395 [Geobacterales bacterium]|nr:hypothetical protein [Geobacterales bacterium]
MTLENSPSKVVAADQPFSHLFSTEAVTSTESPACATPLTIKDAPGSVWRRRYITVRVEIVRPSHTTSQSEHAVRIAYDLSARSPSSL